MKQWRHTLDFEKQETYIGEFGLTYPFKDTIPILNIFQMPSRLAENDIPPCFRSNRNDVHLTTTPTEGRRSQSITDVSLTATEGQHVE